MEIQAKNIIKNPSLEELREMARKDERTTEFGSASFITKIRNRSAKFTEIITDEPTPEQAETIKKLLEYLKDKELIHVDRTMCQKEGSTLSCHLYVTKDYARLPFMWSQTLFPPQETTGVMTTIDVPEYPERKIIVDAKNLITYAMGSDYMGEIKKSFLRKAMYVAKTRGGLGLHAGSKLLKVKDNSGEMKEVGALMFGLSGTGKSTLTCHHHFLEEPEGVVMRQDDVVLLQEDGYCVGTEDNYYLKTEGVEPEGQPVLYKACISPKASFENISVAEDGKVDFADYELTSNGRTVIYRSDMPYSDDSIDLPRVDVMIFIVRRNDIVPPVVRLTTEQGVAAFMLGESIETSAGDPSKAGQSIRVVGTNPFIVGSEAEEGNIFLKILKKNPHIQCYIMNTGRVGGEEGEKIKVVDSAEIMKQIAKGTIEWKKDEDWNYEVPVSMKDWDIAKFDPKKFYSEEEYKALTDKLKAERKEWLNKFEELDGSVKTSLKLD